MNPEPVTHDEALVQFLYQSPIGLVQATLEGEITMMNPMAAQLLLPLARQGSVTSLFDILRFQAPQLQQLVRDFVAERGMVCESMRILAGVPEGHAMPQRVLALSVIKLGDSGLMASITDATLELQREEAVMASQLHKAARVDPMTALPNRAAALERIESLIAENPAGCCSRFAVVFFDCDRFGHVNDTYGRHAGDALLRALAARLASVVRSRDLASPLAAGEWTAARLDGDEFLVVLDGIDSIQQAFAIAERLLDAMSKPHQIGDQLLHVKLTAGVVPPGQISGDAAAILHDAYLAMAEGKRAGRGRLAAFKPAMRVRATHRGQLEHELYQAISNSELYLVYQPLVDLASNRVTGVEALIRWAHPSRGLIMPQEFISIAEESKLICALGDFVLEEACRQSNRWKSTLGELAPAKMSVNLSRAQLLEPDIVDRIGSLLARTNFDPADLMLEITESLAAQHDIVQKRLRSLKALGIRLALDDFGTGYSSLSSLHLLPVDVIKVDRSFVREIEHSAHHRVLVEATVRVARSLGMHTLAEGVETDAQREILTQLECDEGQGYLFSRPLGVEDVTAWLRDFAGVVAA